MWIADADDADVNMYWRLEVVWVWVCMVWNGVLWSGDLAAVKKQPSTGK